MAAQISQASLAAWLMSTGTMKSSWACLAASLLSRPGVKHSRFYSAKVQDCLQVVLVQRVLQWCVAHVALPGQHLEAQLVHCCCARGPAAPEAVLVQGLQPGTGCSQLMHCC